MELHVGVWPEVEVQADRMIWADLAWERERYGAFRTIDVITGWTESTWRRHTVLTPEPDPAILRGMYGRVANTKYLHLNSRDSPWTRPSRYPRKDWEAS